MLDKGCEKIVESPEAMVALGETVGRSLQSGDFLEVEQHCSSSSSSSSSTLIG